MKSVSLDLMLRSWLFGQEEANSLRNKVIKIWVSTKTQPGVHEYLLQRLPGAGCWKGGLLSQLPGLKCQLSTGTCYVDLGKLPEGFAPILSQLVWGLNKLIYVRPYAITFENILAIVVLMIKSVESIETSLVIIGDW